MSICFQKYLNLLAMVSEEFAEFGKLRLFSAEMQLIDTNIARILAQDLLALLHILCKKKTIYFTVIKIRANLGKATELMILGFTHACYGQVLIRVY
uniref:Uncharacterized protein n=1 Tax=Arundo donax TaxID=35708 RepID=A0A0A9GBZ1_ARUDO